MSPGFKFYHPSKPCLRRISSFDIYIIAFLCEPNMNFRVKKRIDSNFNDELFINKMLQIFNSEFIFGCYNLFEFAVYTNYTVKKDL